MNAAPTADQLARNLSRYRLYAMLKGLHFGLVAAIWVIFVQQRHGMSLTQVTLMDVAFWITMAIAEVPTGVVADRFGRRASIATGMAVTGGSLFAWAIAPDIPTTVAAFMAMAVGITFLSGAEDAFFFESLQAMGRASEYARLTGRIHALSLGAVAVGNLGSGFLASLWLELPMLLAAAALFGCFGLALSFREPGTPTPVTADGSVPARLHYRQIVGQSVTLLRQRPALRYPVFFLVLLPMSSMFLETVFLQPQTLALGVPLAGVGVVVMIVQIANMAGAHWSYSVHQWLGEARLIRLTPVVLGSALVGLAAMQVLPALGLVAVMGFWASVVRPHIVHRIQQETPDAVRATVLSMQSVLFTVCVALVEPLLGFTADELGLPAVYLLLAGLLGLAAWVLLRRSRGVFP
jgi:MFS family permease